MSLLVRPDRMTADNKYSRDCRENFTRPSQFQLSKKLKSFFLNFLLMYSGVERRKVKRDYSI